ncbi:putative metallophosphoesterase [Spathaspora sp. JA1]|nr:putative metallophosphoesterase [Spathaspora sp. JA1]
MNERTPLKIQSDEEAQYEIEESDSEDTFRLNTGTKYLLAISCVAILYFFTIFLPNMFVPVATDLVNINKISEIDAVLTPTNGVLPRSETNTAKRRVNRLILIGDVHAHYNEFRNLLKKVSYNKKQDHIVMLGDFITKGPDSFKILDFLIDNKIDCIMGNHEYTVLQYYATFHRLQQPQFDLMPEVSPPLTIKDQFSDPEFLLAKKLQPKHIKYINQCSVIKKLGSTPIMKNNKPKGTIPGIAVHAGIRWDLSLYDQMPSDNLEMRSFIGAPYYNETTSDPKAPDAVSWSKIYNMKQKEGEAVEKVAVYYGHDARRGLSLKEYTKGLDTRCSRGEKLTAMVIWSELNKNDQVVYMEEPVSVQCQE